MRAGGADLTYLHTFLRGYPNLNLLPVGLDVALQAATIRALARFPMPDSLLIASAMVSSCEMVVSNDRDWQRRLQGYFAQFRWLYLGQ